MFCRKKAPDHINKIYWQCILSLIWLCMRNNFMRTTLDLPESLLAEAMTLTKIQTKTEVIKTALANLIQKEKIQELKQYFGKIDLDINLDELRNR